MAGVCGGLATRLGVRTRNLRTLALLSVLVMGLGALVYVALWVSLVRKGESSSILRRAGSNQREKEILAVATIAALSLLVATQPIGFHGLGVVAWSGALSALGLLMVSRAASDAEKAHLHALATSTPFLGTAPGENGPGFVLRTGASVLLFVVGVNMLSRVGGTPGAAFEVLVGAAALMLGLTVLFAPWWVRTVRDLAQERRARVRAQERADMAAHVHDSVLQTLSLIQRAAANPTEVARLARMQERDLRQWLVDPTSVGRGDNPATTLSALAAQLQRDVEDNYSVAVKLVVVGDCALSDSVRSLMDAAREATINAAKWSDTSSVAVYVEAEPRQVSVFVRDVGCGFDPRAVPGDRQGIARSIVERMNRCGGHSSIRSSLGTGTEVELVLPLADPS